MSFVDKYVSPFLKAHLAGIGAGVSLLLADLNTGTHVSAAQWLAIVAAVLGVGAVVAVAPNTPAPVADPAASAPAAPPAVTAAAAVQQVIQDVAAATESHKALQDVATVAATLVSQDPPTAPGA